MANPILHDELMRTALKELEQAVYNHDQWAETLYGTLICRSTPDERDISADAHHNCRFGQWYHKAGATILKNHPGYAEIGLEHERMHQYAISLLRASMQNVPISFKDYERFLTALKRLKLEIATVQNELQTALFNLDPLTGTPSRIGMLSGLREQLELVRRKHACAIAMMDLDHFKAINDKYGHVVGDKVLVGFAHYLMAHLRPYDKVFRYGGEEFLICLPDTDRQTACEIISRLLEELASLPFNADGKGEFHVTVSSGLTALDPDIPVEQSIDRADKALYAAKARGRNRVVVWDASMNDLPAEDAGEA
ncbi:MAG: diguanylate cyclase [Pseudolabrys sp.]|nr:diguanylate cyclase [Pseudolabrys sp.]